MSHAIKVGVCVCLFAAMTLLIAQTPASKPAANKPVVKKFLYLSDAMNEEVAITKAELAAMKATEFLNDDMKRYRPRYFTVQRVDVKVGFQGLEVKCWASQQQPEPPVREYLASGHKDIAKNVVESLRGCRTPEVKSLVAEKVKGLDKLTPITIEIIEGTATTAKADAAGNVISVYDKKSK